MARFDGSRMGLARMARLGRRQLIVFAILSAVINGMVTAAVGTWLAQSYAAYQRKNEAVQRIADLVYERRIRARMAASAIRRKAEPEEIRHRKRAYDEAFVEWNKKVQQNIFRIRDISGETGVTRLETQFQEMLVPALSSIDSCLTKAYDAEIKGTSDASAILDACQMNNLHQFVLDCGATFTNELDRLMRQSLLSLWGTSDTERQKGIARIDKYCANRPQPAAAAPTAQAPPAPNPASAGIPTPPGPRSASDAPADAGAPPPPVR
jgi:hypothetical protein